MLLPWQITAGARIYDGAAGGSTVTTDALQHFATVWVFAPKGVAGGRNETVTTEDNLTGNGNGNGNSPTGNSHTLSSYQWRGNLGLSLNPTMPGPSPESAAPPEGLVFTAHRKRRLSYSARQLVSPATEEYGDPSPIGHQWLKPAGGVPAYSDDGFNGDADPLGNNDDPGDPRDGITSATGALVPASPDEPGAHQVETGGARSVRIIGPYGTPTGLIGTYTATNAYSPPDTIESNGDGGFNPGQAVGKLEGVSYFQGASTNGWQGNGVGGVASYTVASTWSTATEQAPTVTYTDPETGDTGTSSATYQTQGASMEQVEVRLQTNKEVVEGEPVSMVFLLTKTTVEGQTTTSDFVASLRLTINSGNISDAVELLSGTLPAEVTRQGGVVSMRSPPPVNGQSIGFALLPIDLAIDANRDGVVAVGENASMNKPYRFWINNDDDPNTLDDNVEAAMKEDENSPPDGRDWFTAINLGHIEGVRDLEDFTRLHLAAPAEIIAKAKQGTVKIGFKWTDGGGARIRLYKAQAVEGDAKYLFYPYEADLQVKSGDQYAVLDIKENETVYLPDTFWQRVPAGASKVPFIFEGCTKGTARLTAMIDLGQGMEVEGPGVWIKLMDVQEMFERGKVAHPMADPDHIPDPWVSTEPLTAAWTTDPNSNPFQPDPDETKHYIVHVHGWRMTYHEAQTWANTTFKRFWHLGYKGRYAFFSWPTFNAATNNAQAYATYNRSEYRAWLSGIALKGYAASLPAGYNKNIMAHSMGNVVVGSAFRQGMEGFANYSMLNAAMAAQAYNADIVDIMADTPDTDSDLTVRTRFGLSGKFGNIPAMMTNFYLEDDFATTIWSLNHVVNKPQRIRPPLTSDARYVYSDNGYSIDGVLHKIAQADGDEDNYTPVRGVAKLEESMAFVTKTRSLPAGRTPDRLGTVTAPSVDMDSNSFENNYRLLFGSEHSAEWIWSLQRTLEVWRRLMYSFDLMPNPMP